MIQPASTVASCDAFTPLGRAWPRTHALWLLLTMMISMVFGAAGCAARQQEIMHATPDKPRHLTVGMRATSGSRYALVRAADELLLESSILELGVAPGGSQYCYFAHGDDPEVAVRVATMSSSASIADILGVLRAVEERLTEPGSKGPPSVSVELWWVEGVHLDTPELELPNPEIFSKRSVNMPFVSGAEEALVYTIGQGTQSRFEARRIARQFEAFDNGESLPQERMEGDLDYLELEALADDKVLYTTRALDEADAVAVASRLAEFVAVHARIPGTTYQVERQINRRKSQRVHPLQIAIPTGSSREDRALAWVRATLTLADEQHVALVNTVVFRMTDTLISGAVLGQPVDTPPKRLTNSLPLRIQSYVHDPSFPEVLKLEVTLPSPHAPPTSRAVNPQAP